MLDLLRNRRSIRAYKETAITPEQYALLQEALLRSPSSRGIDPWEFLFVTEKTLLAELSQAKPSGGLFLKNAPLGVVILGNGMLSDTWIEDCSIAATILQLTCEHLGLGSCWIQIRGRQHTENSSAEDEVRRILSIPEHLRVECIISIGHPTETLKAHDRENLKDQKIHTNRYKALS